MKVESKQCPSNIGYKGQVIFPNDILSNETIIFDSEGISDKGSDKGGNEINIAAIIVPIVIVVIIVIIVIIVVIKIRKNRDTSTIDEDAETKKEETESTI